MIYNNAIWAMLGMGVFAFSQWGFVILISKFLGPADVGNYALGMAIINPIFAFFSFQLRAHFATNSDSKFEFKEYLFLRIVLLFAIFILSLALSYCVKSNLMFLFLVLILLCVKGLDFISDIFYAVFQRQKILQYTAISQMSRGIVGLIIFSLTLATFENMYLAFFFVASTWAIVLIFFDKRKVIGLDFDLMLNVGQINFGLIRETWTMAFAVLLSSLCMNIPRYLVSYGFGEVALGRFAAQAYFLTLMCMFSVSIAQSVSGSLADTLKINLFHFYRLLGVPILIIFAVSLIFYIISIYMGDFIVQIIYSKEFKTSDGLLSIIMLSSGFWGGANVLDYGLVALRVLYVRPFVVLISMLSMLGTWIICFPEKGIDAAGYCLLVGGICQFSACLFLLVVFRPREGTICLQAPS